LGVYHVISTLLLVCYVSSQSFFSFRKLGIQPKDRLTRGIQSHRPRAGVPI
jgi:hypothetical protein